MTYNFFPPSNKDSDLLTKQERVDHSPDLTRICLKHQTPNTDTGATQHRRSAARQSRYGVYLPDMEMGERANAEV